MLKIEEAADDFAGYGYGLCGGIEEVYVQGFEGFKAGVEFAQQWIPVEEELPQKMQTEPTISKVVQVKSKNFKEPFCAFYDHLHNIWIPYPFGSNSQILEITHWRPTEIK